MNKQVASIQPSENANTTTAVTTKPKLLDQVREAIRLRHYSIRTEHTYVDWVYRYIIFHNKRHPAATAAEPDPADSVDLKVGQALLPVFRA